MKPLKEAVSLVITNEEGHFLAVKRPESSTDSLAGVWGFPAVIVQENETHQQAAARVGAQKLGVTIALGEKMGESTHERATFRLHLTDYRATIASGTPKAPQTDTSVVQYSECAFSNDPSLLFGAAQKGSQCTQLYLDSIGADWKNAKAA